MILCVFYKYTYNSILMVVLFILIIFSNVSIRDTFLCVALLYTT